MSIWLRTTPVDLLGVCNPMLTELTQADIFAGSLRDSTGSGNFLLRPKYYYMGEVTCSIILGSSAPLQQQSKGSNGGCHRV